MLFGAFSGLPRCALLCTKCTFLIFFGAGFYLSKSRQGVPQRRRYLSAENVAFRRYGPERHDWGSC
jgi:hypothetical protein